MQSRVMSGAEAMANTLIGYAVSLAATAIVLPLFGYAVSAADAVGISIAFTAISLVRSYALRRAFNWWQMRGAGYGKTTDNG
jgi:hypothetical protein